MLDATHDEVLSVLKGSQVVDLVVQHESFFAGEVSHKHIVIFMSSTSNEQLAGVKASVFARAYGCVFMGEFRAGKRRASEAASMSNAG
jgi:hypothetical protein